MPIYTHTRSMTGSESPNLDYASSCKHEQVIQRGDSIILHMGGQKTFVCRRTHRLEAHLSSKIMYRLRGSNLNAVSLHGPAHMRTHTHRRLKDKRRTSREKFCIAPQAATAASGLVVRLRMDCKALIAPAATSCLRMDVSLAARF